MSFDRPDYLAKVLASLRTQIEAFLDDRTIVLFQDGALSAYSGTRNASEASISQCINVFQKAFPNGLVKESTYNLGVALNFDRAERFAYEELAADAAIFLEDDMVLSKYYISTLDKLIVQFANDDRVGYVAAYGDHTKSIEEQQANRDRLILLGHNWGFALFKRQWLKMRNRVLEYLEVIKGCDYKDRDSEKIKKLFASWGYGDPAISQDAAKTIACCGDGVVKLNTYVCNAAYIGERGLHMNEKIFAERGYSRTAVYPDPIEKFNPLDEALYQRLLDEQRGWAKSTRTPPKHAARNGSASESKTIVKSEAGLQSVDRIHNKATDVPSTDLVTVAYRSILGRDPDANGLTTYVRLFEDRPFTEALQRTITGLLKSGEFSRKWESDQARFPAPMLLILQRALLGNVPECLRGLTCGWAGKEFTIRFIVDGQMELGDAECLRTVVELFKADCSLPITIRDETMRSDYPSEIRLNALHSWAYVRRERPVQRDLQSVDGSYPHGRTP